MNQFDTQTYVVTFTKVKRPAVVLTGIRALARFAANDLYKVEGLNGRALTELELNEWERLTDLIFGVTELPRGLSVVCPVVRGQSNG